MKWDYKKFINNIISLFVKLFVIFIVLYFIYIVINVNVDVFSKVNFWQFLKY